MSSTITVSVVLPGNGQIVNFANQNPQETTMDDMLALVAQRLQVQMDQICLKYEGKDVTQQQDRNKTLQQIGIKNGDVLVLEERMLPFNPQNPFEGIDMTKCSAKELQIFILRNKRLLAFIQRTQPQLAAAVLQQSTAMLDNFLRPIQGRGPMLPMDQIEMGPPIGVSKREWEIRQRLEKNPMDVEAQKMMEEMIQQKNAEENFLLATEHNPEAFSSVIMLYVAGKINGHPLKIFVDTGAQRSVMTRECAEQCGIMRLADRRFSGVAVGVGTTKIIGRVHMCQLQLGNSFFPISVDILDQKSGGAPVIFGLNEMKRHQCLIDLANGVMNIGSEKIKFLAEKDLEKSMKPRHTPVGQGPGPQVFDKDQDKMQDEQQQKKEEKEIKKEQQPSQPQPTPQQSNPQPSSQPTQQPSNVSQQQVSQLMEITSCSKEQATQALQVAQGNMDLAISMLLG